MADSKLTALTADGAPASTDITYNVEDPAGSPVSKKVTWADVAASTAFTDKFPQVLLWDGDSYEPVTAATIYADPDGTGSASAGSDPGDVYIGPGRVQFNDQTGTTYTLAASDEDKVITLSNASTITLTVPTNASVPIPVGAQFHICWLGVGQPTVALAGGVTWAVTPTPGAKLRAAGAMGTLIKKTTNTWLLTGDLAA